MSPRLDFDNLVNILFKILCTTKGHNRYLIGAMLMCFAMTLAVIYTPGLNTVFKLTALSSGNFFVAFGLAFAIIPVVEIVKAVQRSWKGN